MLKYGILIGSESQEDWDPYPRGSASFWFDGNGDATAAETRANERKLELQRTYPSERFVVVMWSPERAVVGEDDKSAHRVGDPRLDQWGKSVAILVPPNMCGEVKAL
jgi:hypothetical protein